MHLKNKFDIGEFAVLAEIETVKGVDVSGMVNNAKKVKGQVDAFVAPELASAVMRMSALGAAMILQNKGFETVMQVCCRDRNRLALQADLLSAYGTGISNIMVVKGEDPSFGDHHKTKPVYDIDEMELLSAVKSLQSGRDMAGIELTGAPSFFTGAALDINAKGEAIDAEIEKMNRKVEAGVGFFITPPVFDVKSIEPFVSKVDKRKLNIIPTVLLLKSVGMARYIDRHMQNVTIPADTIKRIQKAADKARECVKIAAETIITLKEEGYSGAMLSLMGWEHKMPEIFERL